MKGTCFEGVNSREGMEGHNLHYRESKSQFNFLEEFHGRSSNMNLVNL
jgi:hypothetical protein